MTALAFNFPPFRKTNHWIKRLIPVSFDSHVCVDSIGVPREFPNEFRARNQIAAGFESAMFRWSTINKNVDWEPGEMASCSSRGLEFTIVSPAGRQCQIPLIPALEDRDRWSLRVQDQSGLQKEI